MKMNKYNKIADDMMGCAETELMPRNYTRKSFYGKGRMKTKGGNSLCVSYNTAVALITKKGEFVRLWDAWSATTGRHIDSFVGTVGFPSVPKKVWDKMEVGKPYTRRWVLDNA